MWISIAFQAAKMFTVTTGNEQMYWRLQWEFAIHMIVP